LLLVQFESGFVGIVRGQQSVAERNNQLLTGFVMDANGRKVYLVDDDPSMLESIAFVLHQAGLGSVSFTEPNAFLDASNSHDIGCVLIDLSMPSMTGIDLLRELRARNFRPPVIVMTGCGSVATAVDAMKLEAFDYLEKPVKHTDLLNAVHSAIALREPKTAEDAKQQSFAGKLATLTNREREIMDLVFNGLLSKQIATKLGISVKTVEVHRSHVTKKLGARSVAELVRWVTVYRLENEK
jgi:FixJ family two-component response regulator